MAEKKTPKALNKGALHQSLHRNLDQVKTDRADSIHEEIEIFFRREIEDLRLEIKSLKSDQDAQLDLSPDDANALVNSKNFDARQFIDREFEFLYKIKQKEITLELAESRYEHLFGKKV